MYKEIVKIFDTTLDAGAGIGYTRDKEIIDFELQIKDLETIKKRTSAIGPK